MTRRSFAARLFAVAVPMLLAACARQQAPATADTRTGATSKADACVPTVRDAWIRLVPGGDMPMDAGYAVIDNPCATPAVIARVTSDAYADVSVHESIMQDGMSRMRPVDALRIEPMGRVELKPGGLHLMLMAPRARPTPGQRVAIRFELQDGRPVSGTFDARPIAAP